MATKPKPAHLSFQLPSHLKSASVVPAFLRYWEPKFKRVSLHNASLEASSEAKPDVSFNKTDEHVDIVKAKKPNDTLTKKQMASSATFSKSGGAPPFQFSEQQKQVLFKQTHNQGLRQLLLTVSWDLRA